MKHIYRLPEGFRVELKNMNRYFSDKKYESKENALRAALAYREEAYQILKEAGVKNPTNGRLRPKLLKISRCEIPGVTLNKKRKSLVIRAAVQSGGCSRSFSLSVHDPKDAFKMAIDWRTAKEQELYGFTSSQEVDEFNLEEMFYKFMDSYVDKYPELVNL